jgi:type I restriction enzyme S subunit
MADVVVSNVDKHSNDGEPAVTLCNYVDVYKNTYIDSTLRFMASTASEEQVRRYSLRTGDVIITKDSETPTDIAVPALVTEDIPGLVCGYHLAIIRADVSKVNPRFLLRAIQAKTTASYFANAANGITRYGLTYYSLKNVPLPVPTLTEQEQIADFLDRETAEADALVAKYERLIELLEEKRVALITQAVTKGLNPNVPMKDSGVEWIGEIPRHWRTPAFGYVAEIVLGKMRASEPSAISDVFVPYLKARNVTADRVDFETNDFMWCSVSELVDMRIRPGDIIVCEGGVTFGRSAIASTDCPEIIIFEKSLHRLRPSKKVAGKYLNYILVALRASGFLSSIAATATFAHLTREKLISMRFSMPPIEEQCAIVGHIERQLSEQRKAISKVRSAAALVKERRAALITAAVTGQIDVSTYRSEQHLAEIPA